MMEFGVKSSRTRCLGCGVWDQGWGWPVTRLEGLPGQGRQLGREGPREVAARHGQEPQHRLPRGRELGEDVEVAVAGGVAITEEGVRTENE